MKLDVRDCAAAALGLALRFAVFNLEFVAARPELNSPTNSFHRLTEERYSSHQSILAKALFAVLGQKSAVWCCFLSVCDLASSVLVSRLVQISSSEKQTKTKSFYWHLFNPLSIVAAGGCSAGVLTNLVLLSLWWCSLKSRPVPAAVLLLLAAADRFYPAQLIIPIWLLMNSKCDRRRFALTTTLLLALIFGTFGGDVLFSNWRLSFHLDHYQPGLNVTWYMLIELFDHFRQFFIVIIQIHSFCYVIPLCCRFDPATAIKYLIPLVMIFSPYATLSDFALLTSILPMFPAGRRQFFGLLVLVTSLALCPVMWYLWIQLGSANANFYFATTLAAVSGAVFLITDSIFAELTRLHKTGLTVRLEKPKLA